MAKTGYEQTSVDEVRRILQEEHGIEDEEFLGNTKTVLVTKLLELKGEEQAAEESEEAIDQMFAEAEEETEDTAMQPYTEEESQQVMPAYASEEWHEYVMRQFREDELVEEAPTCDGCRRVVEQVLGTIVSSTLLNVYPPNTTNNGTATVSVCIDLLVTNESHPLCGQRMVCEEIADVNKDNCDHPYYKYASATAASRAEGRALRKLLRLRNVTTAEEKSEKAETTDADCEWHVDEPVSDSQISVLDMLCGRLDISVMDFVNSGKRVYDEIETVTKSTAQRMIQELNKIQRKQKNKPETVGPYDQNWRKSRDEKGE
jgi:hypothetical protein